MARTAKLPVTGEPQKSTLPEGAPEKSRADDNRTDDNRTDDTCRFDRARTARSAEILEDYTELIGDLIAEHGEARVTDIARRLGVTHPTATKALARLKREGLVTSRPYRGVFLTGAGAAMAERVRARHRLVVDLLVAIGVPAEAAETDAEGMEHYVSETTLEAFRRFLDARKA
ncbi:manganese-binding transcriptional regulator MntR [Aquabacter sediminis]|uniref:manganese-binding transcriptional regulator MntR n=1 Tax=Aquabacter sediminis TaxID=3029197 RepID=UPI00237E945F|nr:manganese-binding transcriptional regulator MntR [Aquabacter sp. P-9]MDE1568989.1 manganese-binding transcriptional regulator MntR [Aquabacter sp. P-9]